MVETYPGEADIKTIRSHCHKFMHSGLKVHTDLREEVASSKTVNQLKVIATELINRRKEVPPAEKITWYYRYWNSMNIKKEVDPTYVFTDWNY